MEWIIIYLIVSILLGEGLVYNYRKAKQRTPPWEYFIILTIWPLCMLAATIIKLRSK